jgi:hypothetical protein
LGSKTRKIFPRLAAQTKKYIAPWKKPMPIPNSTLSNSQTAQFRWSMSAYRAASDQEVFYHCRGTLADHAILESNVHLEPVCLLLGVTPQDLDDALCSFLWMNFIVRQRRLEFLDIFGFETFTVNF